MKHVIKLNIPQINLFVCCVYLCSYVCVCYSISLQGEQKELLSGMIIVCMCVCESEREKDKERVRESATACRCAP